MGACRAVTEFLEGGPWCLLAEAESLAVIGRRPVLQVDSPAASLSPERGSLPENSCEDLPQT